MGSTDTTCANTVGAPLLLSGCWLVKSAPMTYTNAILISSESQRDAIYIAQHPSTSLGQAVVLGKLASKPGPLLGTALPGSMHHPSRYNRGHHFPGEWP